MPELQLKTKEHFVNIANASFDIKFSRKYFL